MLNSIWGTQTCLNNLYDNQLFFLALENHQAAENFQYRPPLPANLGLIKKIQILFEKFYVSILAIIPGKKDNVRRAFIIVQHHKDNQARQQPNPPPGAAVLPGAAPQCAARPGPLPSAPPLSPPPVQHQDDQLRYNPNPPPGAAALLGAALPGLLPSAPPLPPPTPLPPSIPAPHEPSPRAPSDNNLSLQANNVNSVVIARINQQHSKPILSVGENNTIMIRLRSHVQGIIEDPVTLEPMIKPVMIPCGHIQNYPESSQVSQEKTPNGLTKTVNPEKCPLCNEGGPIVDFIITSDELTEIIKKEGALLAELERLTNQHKMLSEQLENLKLHRIDFVAGNVDKLAVNNLPASLPVLEAEEKGADEFIKDPVMLLCGHIHSLEVAKQKFGEIAKDSKERIAEGFPKVPKLANCPECKKRVLTYLDTAALRNTMVAGNELLAHRKLLNEATAALNNELVVLQSPNFVPGVDMGIASASAQHSKELSEMEEKLFQNNEFMPEMVKNPPPLESSVFTCNRPWTGLTLEEEMKYSSERHVNGEKIKLKAVRWKSWRNVGKQGSDSLIYYARAIGFEDGSLEVRLMSGHKKVFQQYLDKFKFALDSSPEEAARTSKNNRGQEVSTGVFIARTPREIAFALSLLINNEKNSFKEPELFALTKRLLLHPENWNVVEHDEHELITSAKIDYDAVKVRLAQVKKEDRAKAALAAANNKEPEETQEEALAKETEAWRRFEQERADRLLAEELAKNLNE